MKKIIITISATVFALTALAQTPITDGSSEPSALPPHTPKPMVYEYEYDSTPAKGTWQAISGDTTYTFIIYPSTRSFPSPAGRNIEWLEYQLIYTHNGVVVKDTNVLMEDKLYSMSGSMKPQNMVTYYFTDKTIKCRKELTFTITGNTAVMTFARGVTEPFMSGYWGEPDVPNNLVFTKISNSLGSNSPLGAGGLGN